MEGMEGQQLLRVPYLAIGVIGFFLGVVITQLPSSWRPFALFVTGAVVLLVYAVTMDQKQVEQKKTTAEDDVEVLLPDQARQWLDEFLVKQQTGNSRKE
jgi:hypothetical protein